MVELLAADAVGDVLDVAQRVLQAALLGADDEAAEVGVDDLRAQALELGDQLQAEQTFMQ